MTLDSDLARYLDRAIPHPPSAAASAYLTKGRQARRRRRAHAAMGGVAALVLIGGALSLVDHPGADTVPNPPATSSGPSAEIPDWAQEYGNHGPAAIAPNGDLWIAPDARLLRRVDNPLGTIERADDVITTSYAVEAEMDGEVVWSFIYERDGIAGGAGFLDYKGWWTNDFDIWLDESVASMKGEPGLGARMVEFADNSSRLVARPGATIVRQIADVTLPLAPDHPRHSVAEVTYAGRSWYVEAIDFVHGPHSYRPYETAVVAEPGLAGFLDYLATPVDK